MNMPSYLSLLAPFRAVFIAVCALGAVFFGSVAPADAIATYQLPTLAAGDTTWVLDDADLISRLSEGKLSEQLGKLAQKSEFEARLVTIHHFDYGETVQSFTDQLFESWYPTPTEQSNQVLLVLDEVSKTVGIRVGEAASALLPADLAASIAQETTLVPLLKGDKYNEAFLDASERLVAVLSGEPDPGPPIFEDAYDADSTFASAEDTSENRSNYTVVVVVLLVLATVIPMATYFFYQGMGS